MHEKLRSLQHKKAMLLLQMESLDSVNGSAFTQLGKVEFDIRKTERQIFRETKNTFEDEA